MKFILLISACLLSGWGGYEIHEKMLKKGCLQLTSDVVAVDIQLPSPSQVKFIAMGDTGTGNLDQKKVANAVQQVCNREGCDFVLLLGDNFYPDGVTSVHDPQFQTAFESMYAPIQKPFFAILGNHDYRGDVLSQVFYSLQSPIWRMPNFNYQFKAGPVQFFALNTECYILSWEGLQNQMKLVTSPSPWTFLYTHQPIYGSGVHGDADWPMRQFWNFFQEEIDFYLSGHNHQLEHLQKSGDSTEYIISGAGGKHYRSPSERQKIKPSQAMSKFSYQDIGFVWFEVSETQALVKFFNGDGDSIYEFTKKKND